MPKIVVFVDDSKTVLMTAELAVKPLVESGDIEIVTYDEAMNFLSDVEKGFTFDLLITDVNMPKINGLDMAKQIKNNPRLKLKPILALTTENSQKMKMLGKQIGLTGWITKPFSPTTLVKAIKRVLRIR